MTKDDLYKLDIHEVVKIGEKQHSFAFGNTVTQAIRVDGGMLYITTVTNSNSTHSSQTFVPWS
jgi:uncharacterized protein YjlB